MQIEPKQPTTKNPPEQFVRNVSLTTTWPEHITEEEHQRP